MDSPGRGLGREGDERGGRLVRNGRVGGEVGYQQINTNMPPNLNHICKRAFKGRASIRHKRLVMARMTTGGFLAAVRNSLFAVNIGVFLLPTLEIYRPSGTAYCGADVTRVPTPITKESKTIPVHAKKRIIWGSGCLAPLVLNLGIC
jgi:hypothetical protein